MLTDYRAQVRVRERTPQSVADSRRCAGMASQAEHRQSTVVQEHPRRGGTVHCLDPHSGGTTRLSRQHANSSPQPGPGSQPAGARMSWIPEDQDSLVIQHNEATHAAGMARASAQSSTSSGLASGCLPAISAAARRRRSGSAASGWPSSSAAATARSPRSGRACGLCS